MKILKVLGITLALLFGLSLVFIPIIKDHSLGQASAKTIIFPPPQASQSATPINYPPGTKEVNYYLPYPGILPDHPFYWLKMIRDRLKLILAKDDLIHYQLLILYTDKRIGAAQVLVRGNKVALGVSTATKAEKYFEQVITAYEKLKTGGKTTAIIDDQIVKAAGKHQEILQKLLEEVSQSDQGSIRPLLEAAQRNYQRALNLTGKKE